jgi:hypothetical protein
MAEWVRKTAIDRLNSLHMHVDPRVAVKEMTEEESREVPYEGGRSPKELLYHIVFWQDYVWDMIRGTTPAFKKGSDWKVGSETWEWLVERLEAGLSGLLFIAENWELDEEVKINDEHSTTVGAELIGIAQHTSYHVGQLVTTRRALGKWHKS